LNKDDYDLNDLSFQFFQNEELKQDGKTRDMIFSVDTLITYVSQFITLKTGDLLYTGTPAGVGQVHIGDVLTGYIEGVKVLELEVA
jgi:2-keto-4-pentenoate hydratase/2-oxohepta-3-ene-1,7-dioic acid hydratase in catechol pathway